MDPQLFGNYFVCGQDEGETGQGGQVVLLKVPIAFFAVGEEGG